MADETENTVAVDASDVIATLSQQISSLSVDLAIAKAQINALRQRIDQQTKTRKEGVAA